MSLFEQTLTLEVTPKSRELISMCVSMSISYPDFSSPSKIGSESDNFSRLATWLERLINKTNEAAQLSDYNGDIGQLAEYLLILSIHFHFEQRDELQDVMKKELKMNQPIKSLTIQRLKTLFTTKFYTQEMVSE